MVQDSKIMATCLYQVTHRRITPLLLTVVLLQALWFLPTTPQPGRDIPHKKVIPETSKCHQKGNRDGKKVLLSTFFTLLWKNNYLLDCAVEPKLRKNELVKWRIWVKLELVQPHFSRLALPPPPRQTKCASGLKSLTQF